MLLRYTNLAPHSNHLEFRDQNTILDNQKENMNIGYFIKSEKKELIVT